MRTRRGFTLLELILVVAILAVVTGIVWVSRGDTVQDRTLRKDATALVASLRQGRAVAVARSTRVRVTVEPEAIRLEVLENPDQDLEAYVAPTGAWARPQPREPEVEVEMILVETGETVDHVIFHPDGRATRVEAVFRHPRVAERYRVIVDPLTGLARIAREREEGF